MVAPRSDSGADEPRWGRGRVVIADEAALGASDGGEAAEDAHVAGDAEAPGVGDALPIAH